MPQHIRRKNSEDLGLSSSGQGCHGGNELPNSGDMKTETSHMADGLSVGMWWRKALLQMVSCALSA